MLRITIELVPKGDERRKHVVCIGEIHNDATSEDEHIGNYQCWFSKFAPRTHEVWKYADVKGFPRKLRGHWDLIYLALKDALGGRNP